MKKIKRVYLDHAAATPLDKSVKKAMEPYADKVFGNPGALHHEGVEAKGAVTNARLRVAALLGAHPDEITFVGSGTAGNNLAITGLVKQYFESGFHSQVPHVITSAIEHPSVLRVVSELERKGTISATYVPVSSDGIVDTGALKDALRPETILVSVMYANNEIGTVEPIREIAKIVRDARKQSGQIYPYLHTDAAQAINYLDTNVERLGVDMLTFNGSKIYGPKGIGVLYKKRGVAIAPLLYGGDQEQGLWAGTESVANIVGCAQALEETLKLKESEALRLSVLRDHFFDHVGDVVPHVRINGSRTERLANNINISVPGIESTELIMRLDAKGIAVSAKSACKSADEEASYVIRALGAESEEDMSSVRVTMGRSTTQTDIDSLLGALGEIVSMIRGGKSEKGTSVEIAQ